MNTFFTADLHFDHKPILKWAKRPFKDLDEMHDVIISKWNNKVGRNDRIYIIGDFAFKNHGRWVNKLHGKKILIQGNHDEMSQKYIQQFTRVYDFGLSAVINKKRMTLCHYPMRSWDDAVKGAWHLHGHCHQRLADNKVERASKYGLMVDVGVDGWNFEPVAFEEVAELMKQKEDFLAERGRKFSR